MTPIAADQFFRFGESAWLAALWGVPILLAILVIAGLARRAAARRFIDAGLLGAMSARVCPTRRALRAAAALLALTATVLALARPQWDPEPTAVTRSGRDVCFIIDVSRSMLADDLAPNRLERTKLWVKDAAATLRGDRVALVAFAGHSVVKCPLTLDYGFFRLAVDELSPQSVSRGGTMIGDAFRLAVSEVFGLNQLEDDAAESDTRYRDIILITDGEDQGSLPVAAAEAAGQLGIRAITIGIGSEQGQRIPYLDERGRTRYVKDNEGNYVFARLDTDTLTKMALATPGGAFFNVADGTIQLDTVYQQMIQQSEKNQAETDEVLKYQEGFQYVLGIALALLFFEGFIGDRRRGASL